MRYLCIPVLLLLIGPLGLTAQNKKKASKPQVVTGCLDEKPGVYVLRGDDALKEIVQLEPVGFEKEVFARFVGHKVSVSGTLLNTTDPPTLRVSNPGSVKDISEMCIPASGK